MGKLQDLEEISDSGLESSSLSSMDRDNHDQSPTVDSTHSGNSFAYCRTNSETSAFSDQLTDDFNSCSSDTNSPVCWPVTVRSPYRPTLSRFGGIRHNHKLDQKPVDLGNLLLQFNKFIYKLLQNLKNIACEEHHLLLLKEFGRKKYVV